MTDPKSVQKQLKKLKFSTGGWNQAEVRELPHILHDHEQISECVNGFYEGGVALLVATDARLLLIDKKPLNYLNVEDLRFDMINEIDYSHRLMGASITISTGSKTLQFRSYNKSRLRSLINLVQEQMSQNKKEQSDKADNQQQHLEEINKQLQMYLMAQHQQLQQQMSGNKQEEKTADLPKPDPRLADYLFAQRLLEQFHKENGSLPEPLKDAVAQAAADQPPAAAKSSETDESSQSPMTTDTAEPAPEVPPQITQQELVADAQAEVFGKQAAPAAAQATPPEQPQPAATIPTLISKGIEINPLRVAYSKLPMMLRNRRFGRPSFHAHSQQEQPLPTNPELTY